ncbi:phosphatidate phosphatase [Biomphalaria glabrata]|nr:phosphatidate phosphatase [Biomphalaria glabrata]
MTSLAVSKQVIVDFFVFLSLCVPVLIVHIMAEPVIVGFFCKDESLTLPYKPDTVSQALLLIVSVGSPFVVIAVTEGFRAAAKTRQPQRVRTAMFIYAKAFGLFLFGLVINCIFTDTIKYSFGRLRPHFLDLCKPDFTKFNCTDEYGVAKYIQDYECTNTLADEKLIKDSHMSFPSGHASVSVYSAIFVVLYLQLRMNITVSHFLRPALQVGFLLMATLCCVTRVTDHKHFSTDVIAGSLLGATTAGLLFFKIGWRLIPGALTSSPPRLPRATSIESEPQTPTPLLRPERLVINNIYKNGNVQGLKDGFLNKV